MPVFLRYGQVRGDVREPAHRGWIELTSAHLGASRRVPPRDKPREEPRGPVLPTEIILTKGADSASVHLQREAVAGSGVDAVVDFSDADGTVYFRLELSGARAASYSVSGSSQVEDVDIPVERITLRFSQIEFKNSPGTPPP